MNSPEIKTQIPVMNSKPIKISLCKLLIATPQYCSK
jgi:hypothetical protein